MLCGPLSLLLAVSLAVLRAFALVPLHQPARHGVTIDALPVSLAPITTAFPVRTRTAEVVTVLEVQVRLTDHDVHTELAVEAQVRAVVMLVPVAMRRRPRRRRSGRPR